MAKVAFLGLGVMGYPMAGHLRTKGGHDVTVYNRTAAKADKWVAQFGGKSAPTPKQAAEGQDFVMCCVGNDDDLRQVTLGADGAFSGMKKGALFVDHTTASAEIARDLYKAGKERGFDVIDAPVSGGQAGAENGALTVMCGGDADVFARAEPVIAAYARALQSARRTGCRPAREDGQPDLHRRHRAGSLRRSAFREESRSRRREADRHHLQGRGAILADGKPLQDHDRRQVRFRFRGRLDAQGSRHLPVGSPTQRRASAGHRARRSVLFGSAIDGRQALGHVEPDRVAGAQSNRRLISEMQKPAYAGLFFDHSSQPASQSGHPATETTAAEATHRHHHC